MAEDGADRSRLSRVARRVSGRGWLGVIGPSKADLWSVGCCLSLGSRTRVS